ncbi:MAG TPA: MMPL family transporter [Jatrophihabitans sp.]|jgi:RND superfamily putative drug exporter|uniref:MMPL family transporter n=1 Tax=Jatrophihabitans sp. TaxID=1932789 RepID=UPI002E09FB44|nr:MMPL family transporter [Jatrophihabitans sp.]
MAQRRNLAASLARWSATHRAAAIGSWVLLVLVTVLIGGAVGQVHMTRAEYGVGESGRAEDLLVQAGVDAPAQELVYLHSATAAVDRTTVQSLMSGVTATGVVTGLRPPVVSPTGRDVLIEFAMKGPLDQAQNHVQPVLDAVAKVRAAHPALTVEQFGDASANKWFEDTIGKDATRAEWTAVPLALGILLVVFGALLAAVLPVLLALTAFLAANGLLALISHAMHVDPSASSVMLLMGLAVGVDYCLFYLRREREERSRGHDPRRSLEIAAATSGRSVLVSGLTVMVAMAGMFLSGMQLFAGFAVASISVVLIAVVGSVTVLPALMSLLGDKVELGRIPLLSRRRFSAEGGRFWRAVLKPVLAHPAVSAALAGAALLVLAAPALSLHTETLSVEQILPTSTPIVRSYQHITRAFPGGPAPAVIVLRTGDTAAPRVTRAIADLRTEVSRRIPTGQAIRVVDYASAGLVRIEVPLTGSGSDATSRAALGVLHDRIVPSTLGRVPGAHAYVGGALASSLDFTAQLRRGIVPVIVVVMAITFVLMLVAFGSLVIPATTIVLNLLSVAAAYGVMVAVFQYGWGIALINATAPGAIESWIPLFVFVVLFGLSMDYNVFVVSRIKEAHDSGRTTRDAVRDGVRGTASVVTSAAVIMVTVFAVFGTLSLQQFKQLSVGLAVAILLDATVVRAVLLPSVMALLDDRNWYLPRWMRRLTTRGGTAPSPVEWRNRPHDAHRWLPDARGAARK